MDALEIGQIVDDLQQVVDYGAKIAQDREIQLVEVTALVHASRTAEPTDRQDSTLRGLLTGLDDELPDETIEQP